MVDRPFRKLEGRLDGRHRGAGEQGLGVLRQAVEVHAGAAGVVVEHALGMLGLQTHAAHAHRRAHHVDAENGNVHAVEEIPHHALHQRLVVTAWRIDDDDVGAFQRLGNPRRVVHIHLHPVDREARAFGGSLQHLELAFQHEVRGHDGELLGHCGTAERQRSGKAQGPAAQCAPARMSAVADHGDALRSQLKRASTLK